VYRFDRVWTLRAAVIRWAFEVRGFNPLPREAPGGRRGDETPSGPRGRFQPAPAAPADPPPPGLRPPLGRNLPRTAAKAPRRTPTTATRSTAPATRQVASWTASPVVGRGLLCGRPGRRGSIWVEIF